MRQPVPDPEVAATADLEHPAEPQDPATEDSPDPRLGDGWVPA